jgi:hypothetical protein
MSSCTCPSCRRAPRLHLAGEPTPELLSTLHLLEQRGYDVDCWADLPKRVLLQHLEPTEKRLRELRMVCMINADAVVITDELPAAEARLLREVTTFIARPLVRVEDLPLWAADIKQRGETFRALDICANPEEALSTTDRLMLLVLKMRERLEAIERGFNRSCGWFFTNGQKQAAPQQPKPVPYPVHD